MLMEQRWIIIVNISREIVIVNGRDDFGGGIAQCRGGWQTCITHVHWMNGRVLRAFCINAHKFDWFWRRKREKIFFFEDFCSNLLQIRTNTGQKAAKYLHLMKKWQQKYVWKGGKTKENERNDKLCTQKSNSNFSNGFFVFKNWSARSFLTLKRILGPWTFFYRNWEFSIFPHKTQTSPRTTRP